MGISSHFLNVVGKKVEGNEISVREGDFSWLLEEGLANMVIKGRGDMT